MQRRAPKTRKEKQFSQKITIASRDKLPSGNPEELKRRKGFAKTTPMGVDKKIIRRKVKRREGIKEKKMFTSSPRQHPQPVTQASKVTLFITLPSPSPLPWASPDAFRTRESIRTIY